MIKGIFFDLDGTLLNTLDDMTYCINIVRATLNLGPINNERVRLSVGQGIKNLILDCIDKREDQIDDALALFNQLYAKHYDDATLPYDGIYNLLDYCVVHHIKLACISNKSQSFIIHLIQHHLKDYSFEFIYGDAPSHQLKPNIDGIYLGLYTMNLQPSECLFIGDTEVDHETAINAKMQSITVTWGFRTHKELSELKDTLLMDYPSDVIELLEALREN